jgi:hypothetical protein
MYDFLRRMTTKITTPDMSSMQKVASVRFAGSKYMTVFWDKENRDVLVQNHQHRQGWYKQGDSKLMDTIGHFVDEKDYKAIPCNIVVYDITETIGDKDEQLNEDIYDCIWSDLVYGDMVIHFNIRIFERAESTEIENVSSLP